MYPATIINGPNPGHRPSTASRRAGFVSTPYYNLHPQRINGLPLAAQPQPQPQTQPQQQQQQVAPPLQAAPSAPALPHQTYHPQRAPAQPMGNAQLQCGGCGHYYTRMGNIKAHYASNCTGFDAARPDKYKGPFTG